MRNQKISPWFAADFEFMGGSIFAPFLSRFLFINNIRIFHAVRTFYLTDTFIRLSLYDKIGFVTLILTVKDLKLIF